MLVRKISLGFISCWEKIRFLHSQLFTSSLRASSSSSKEKMLSLNSPKPLSPFHHNHNNSHTTNLHPFRLLNLRTTKHPWKPISAMGAKSSTPPSNQQVYQPFRPPPPPLPSKYRNLDLQGRLEILRDRLGAWYEYAPLIPSLVQQGFTPSSIEEATGISGVEQNRLIVGAKVRDSLAESDIDAQTLSFFDTGGAELLYEIRLLSVSHRVLAARYMVENRFDARGAQELARAVKDFPRRRGDPGWESFDYSSPADCLAYMHFRQSREYRNPSDQRTLALEKALEAAETEKAKKKILDALEVKSGGADEREGEIAIGIKVPVVRLKMGEVSEASSVVFLPVSEAEEGVKGVTDAPEECRSKGVFGVVDAEKGWKRWVVLPGWEPIMGLGSGVVVAFSDARVLPWKVKRWYKEEPILVVADRKKKKVEAEDGFYLVTVSNESGESNSSNGFKVERGSRLTEMGVEECLGSVVLVVRPPKEDIEDQLADEDWE